MKTALLLPGAGALSIWQAAAAKETLRRVKPDMILGSSGGAINGLMLMSGQADELIQMWRKIKNKDVYDLAPWKMFTKSASILDSYPLKKLLEKTWNGVIRTSPYFAVTCTNLAARKGFLQPMNCQELSYIKVPQTKAEALYYIMASASIPVAFPLQGQLCDGGVTNLFMVKEAIAQGADRIIMLANKQFGTSEKLDNVLDVISAMLSSIGQAQIDSELKTVELMNQAPGYKQIEVIRIYPSKGINTHSVLDFDMKGVDRDIILADGQVQAAMALKEYPVISQI